MEASEIVIHEFPPFGGSISASPFPIRVEMFLRWAKLPYTATFESPTHKTTKKTPWIEYKGKDFPDSAFIIELLAKDFDVDIDHHLSCSEKAVSRAFQRMLSEGSLFCGFAWRFHLSDNGTLMVKDFLGNGIKGALIGPLAGMQMRKNMWGQGITRLSNEQILKLCYDDIQAVSDFLEEKAYMMGPKVSSTDCVVYPFLEAIYYTFECSTGQNPIKEFMLSLPNLNEYRIRLQKEFFPDWEQICSERKVRREYVPS